MKTHNLVKTMLLIILILNSKIAHSQISQLNIKSPSVTDFIRYGNTPVSSYSGTIDLKIPLVTVKNNNQRPINIDIAYNSSGFIPSKRSGLVGLNWFLNMGGMITRRINGKPDDYWGQPTSTSSEISTNGFIVGVRNQSFPIANVHSFNGNTGFLQTGEWMLGSQGSTNAYESNPDIFNFNFNGISGKFFMGNDGQVKIVTDQPDYLKVDLTSLSTQYGNSCRPSFSEIKITDGIGNQYFFGGSSNNLEYTMFLGSQYSGHINLDPKAVITSWFLTKIIYSDNSQINFNYRADTLNEESYCIGNAGVTNIQNNKSFLALNRYINEERSSSFLQMCCLGNDSSVSGTNLTVSFELQKKVILDNIVGNDFIINFNYSPQLYKFNRNLVGGSIFEYEDIKLDNINLKDKSNNLITNFDFSYTYLGGTYNRMFLYSITESGKKPYVFEYEVTDNLPDSSTNGVDYWGFWNGGSEQGSLIPNMVYNANGDFTYTSNTREPAYNKSKQGLLQKITYPTGGNTKYEYGPHQYSLRLERPRTNNFLPQLMPVNGTAGGARINKIIDSDGIVNTNIREFIYEKNYSPITTNSASGILLEWPRYAIYWEINNGQGTINKESRIRSNSINSNIFEGSVITYSEVVEKFWGNGYIVNKFKDYSSTPDINDYNIRYNGDFNEAYITPVELYKNYVGVFYNDSSSERGKLISKKTFSDSNPNNPIKEEIFTYNNSADRFNQYSATIHSTGLWTQSNKLYFYSDYLTKKITKTSNNNNNSLIAEENYVYNTSYNQLTSQWTKNSLIQTLETRYFYPQDLPIEPFVTDLIGKNIISLPLKTQTFKNTEKLSENLTEYTKTTDNLLLPKCTYTNKGTTEIVKSIDKKLTFDSYDDKGNLLQYTPESGVPVSIIWGYNQTQPIAKIENATYAQVEAMSGFGVGFTIATALSVNQENTLRTSLTNAMVTTYTYIPLIGISTITDPKGDKITYTYDAFGRLQFVKDKNDKILSENEYHYKN